MIGEMQSWRERERRAKGRGCGPFLSAELENRALAVLSFGIE